MKSNNVFSFNILGVFWASLGICGYWLGFPNDLVHIPPLVLLLPLSLIYFGVKSESMGEAFRKGWLTALLGVIAAMYWLTIPIQNVGGLPWFLAWACAVLVSLYIAVYAGFFSLAVYKVFRLLPNKPLHSALALACAWYGLELLRNYALSGFPWLSLSTAFVPYPLLIQGASLIGSYALSAVYVGLLLLVWHAFQYQDKSKTLKALIFPSVIIVFFGVWGIYSLEKENVVSQETLAQYGESVIKDGYFRAVMIEGNIDQNIKWDIQNQQATFDLHKSLSRSALEENAYANNTLLLWSETAMPFYLDTHPIFGPSIIDFVQDIKTPLLVGAPAAKTNADGTYSVYNRAYLIDQYGAISGYYDKEHLVPFGEYIPFWFKFGFLDGLLQSIGSFAQGTQTAPLSVFLGEDIEHEIIMGMLICYEGIFPEIAQQRVEDGANILVNISNDGWFGESYAPMQHLQATALRAVEQGRWIVRATNTGISAIIDNYGRIRLTGEQFKAQSVIGYAKTDTQKTVFHHMSLFIPWFMLLMFCFALSPCFFKKNKNNKV